MSATLFLVIPNARMITCEAIRLVYPTLVADIDYELKSDGSLKRWKPVPYVPCPAANKLTQLRQQIIARENARLDVQFRRNQMRDMFESLPIITKAMLRNEFLTVNAILDSGKPTSLAEVRIRIEMIQRPDGIELDEEQFTATKNAILGLLPEA